MKVAKMMVRYPTGKYPPMTYQLDEMIGPSQPAVSSCLEPAAGLFAPLSSGSVAKQGVTAEIGRSYVLCFEPRTPAGVSPGRHTICKSKIQRGEQH